VTQYSFRPAVGVKISKILALQNDLALALAAHPIRIEAPIPGRSLVGIEVPNKVSAVVRLRETLETNDFRRRESSLMIALGKDVSGNFIFGDLAKMPHLLIAGATGTGKSVCINSIITTLLYQNSPDDLKFIMVDPKRVELSLYNKIPHLRTDVIVENGKVVTVLKWAVSEMERRYRLLQEAGSRDIASYQDKVRKGKKREYTDPETKETHQEDLENLPFIVIIIDELADLMGSHGKEVEGAIVRIAQMARAVGIHLIISTQRPSVK
jgi:S-DNA-T family DNA segregation ATPase FtsK/SpoIIIE